tara:strand:- start:179 stop:1138 length:960 start_codon:yes stop_codon:yes gene_type:complete
MAITKVSRGLLGTGVVNNTDGGIIVSTDGYGRALLLPADENGTAENNLHYIGSSSYRWRDIYLSGSIDFNSTTVFKTNGSERMRIDSSGNVLVGTTSYNNDIAGIGFGSGNFLYATRSGNVAASFGRLSNDGNVIDFRQDASIVGIIGASGGDLTIGTGDTGIHFHDGVDSLIPWDTSTANYRDDAIDLGTSSYRFDDIYASSGTVNSSDQNEKNTIAESDLGLDFVKKLSPKSYKFNGKTRTHYGLIAQDIETVLTDISKSTTDFAGFVKEDISEEQDGSSYRYGLRYNEFIAPLVKAIQEQQEIIDDLKTRIEELEA